MFEFAEANLKFNKRGQLSHNQKEWLKGIACGACRFSWRGALITVGFMFPVLCIILALYLQNEDSRVVLFSNSTNKVTVTYNLRI
jgi:hypothetical protein